MLKKKLFIIILIIFILAIFNYYGYEKIKCEWLNWDWWSWEQAHYRGWSKDDFNYSCRFKTSDWWNTCSDSSECEAFCEAVYLPFEWLKDVNPWEWEKVIWKCYNFTKFHKGLDCRKNVEKWILMNDDCLEDRS